LAQRKWDISSASTCWNGECSNVKWKCKLKNEFLTKWHDINSGNNKWLNDKVERKNTNQFFKKLGTEILSLKVIGTQKIVIPIQALSWFHPVYGCKYKPFNR
jgi:hypothetical protein